MLANTGQPAPEGDSTNNKYFNYIAIKLEKW